MGNYPTGLFPIAFLWTLPGNIQNLERNEKHILLKEESKSNEG
jgi:hypothetical protein